MDDKPLSFQVQGVFAIVVMVTAGTPNLPAIKSRKKPILLQKSFSYLYIVIKHMSQAGLLSLQVINIMPARFGF